MEKVCYYLIPTISVDKINRVSIFQRFCLQIHGFPIQIHVKTYFEGVALVHAYVL